MALLIPNAQAIVIKISQVIYFVYFLGGNNFIQAITTVVILTKKNISSFIPGIALRTQGNSPNVAPTIIKINRPKAIHFFFFETCVSVSFPFANIKNTRDSPQVGTNVSSAHKTKVSFSFKTIFSK